MKSEEQEEEEEPGGEKTEMRVGRLKKDIWSSERGSDQVFGEQVKLRGARKITKGKTERRENQVLCDAL